MIVLIPEEGESWSAFARRFAGTQGDVLIILPTAESLLPLPDEDELHGFFDACARESQRVILATTKRLFISLGRSKGIRVIDRPKEVHILLHNHPTLDEAMRALSPHIWRQHLRSHLQSMGLLSLPKLRVWMLIFVSVVLLFFVLFRLLPSAEIRVWPHGDTVTQTANIFLVQSGALVSNIPSRVRTLDLVPLSVTVHRSITFDQISKDFTGTNARVDMTVFNNSDEDVSLRKGSRMVNQAGMVFRLQEQVFLSPRSDVTVSAYADDFDVYGEIIGERGNVPAGRRWEFPGLAREDRLNIYAENREAATGGTTSFTTVLKEEDLDIAQKQLEQELLQNANQMLDEERMLINSTDKKRALERLYYDEFTVATYTGFVLPTQFLGEPVSSIPIEGAITYTAFAYDKQSALDMLYTELKTHVGDNKRLIEESISLDRLIHHVIDYEDDLSWIKLTVDLSGKEQYILDPLTPTGARFAMDVRKTTAGKSKNDALRILKNLPEVDAVEISLWPPWSAVLPSIPSHITITPVTQ